MPQIPVSVDEDGYVLGRYPSTSEPGAGGGDDATPVAEIGGVEYSPTWFQYCGVQEYEGLSPAYDGDDYFRHAGTTAYEWQAREAAAGSRVHVDEFADYGSWGNGIGRDGAGKPAAVTWRSAGTDDTIPVLLIRSDRIGNLAAGSGDGTRGGGESGVPARWLAASTDRGFIAVLNKCTHYCCVPGYRAAPSVPERAVERIYCPCHQSIYDPFSVVAGTFTAYPRPEDG